ncbi:MAG: DUF6232 family protein [Paracoccaceae bacterium]
MAKRDESLLIVDSNTLKYAGKVIPLRNIAYFEKYKIKKPSRFWSTLFVIIVIGVISVVLAENNPRDDDEIIAAGVALILAVFLIWLIYLALRRASFALMLQTNAGDLPRLFTTRDERFLDDLIRELTDRLEDTENLPTLFANVENNTINYGDRVMGDKFQNIRDSTIVNRSQVDKSFNTIRNSFDEETALAIRQLAEFINQSGNTEAAAIFDEFNRELAAASPRKPILRSLWTGITNALPAVNTLADVTLKIMKILA